MDVSRLEPVVDAAWEALESVGALTASTSREAVDEAQDPLDRGCGSRRGEGAPLPSVGPCRDRRRPVLARA